MRKTRNLVYFKYLCLREVDKNVKSALSLIHGKDLRTHTKNSN